VETNGLGNTDEISFGHKERQALTNAAASQFANVMTHPFLCPAEIRRQQTSRVAELLRNAFKGVPLYRESFKNAKVSPSDFKEIRDILRFPILRRAHILGAKQEQAISTEFTGKQTFKTQSRGTSGARLSVQFDLAAVIVDSLQGARQLALQSSGGVSASDLTLHYYAYPWWTSSIGGKWRSKFISMDVPALTAANVCRRDRPAAVAGYPTAIRRLMAVTGPGELDPKLIITNSEQSSRLERDQLAAHFECPVLDEYSTEELTRIAIEMPDGFYYVNEDSVFLEILDPKTGRPVEDGEWGEAVATGLLNEAMPFIRYATGDLVKRPKHPNASWSALGWGKLEAVGGRIIDSFFRRDDSVVPSGVIADLLYGAMAKHNIFFEDYQLTQKKPEEAEIAFCYPEGTSMARVADFTTDVRVQLETLMKCRFVLEVSSRQSEGICRYAKAKRRPIRSACVPTALSCSASGFKIGA
jgi:phenylacetate-CoA ligase